MQLLALAGVGLAAISLVTALFALWQVRRAHQRLSEVTPDTRGLAQRVKGQEAEQALAAIFAHLESTSQKMDRVEGEVAELDRVVSRAMRRVGLVRFDANEEIRGELSFALCMLDNRDNGFLLSSVYTLDGCRVYVRGVRGGKTRHDLMTEEAESLEQALGEP